ncbi:hypothetical protein EV145_112139 [Flavobacterium sp. 245]|nr:hypothetical protein EV145_112139 [Flavobacterium sp. 245]
MNLNLVQFSSHPYTITFSIYIIQIINKIYNPTNLFYFQGFIINLQIFPITN